jgi:sugar (pentulose or hexulose) kinase
MACFLGYDIGSLSSKGVLVDQDGKMLAFQQIQHSIEIPEVSYQEQDCENTWWREFKQIIPHLLHTAGVRASDIKTIGVTGLVPAFCKLTGIPTFDYDTAGIVGGIFDFDKMEWDYSRIREFGLSDSIWPRVHPASDIAGQVTAEAALETGLAEGTNVIVGTGDSFASMLGGGCLEKGHMMIYLGTSGTIIYGHTAPKDLISTYHFGPGRTQFVGKIFSSGQSLSNLRDTLGYKWWNELEEATTENDL